MVRGANFTSTPSSLAPYLSAIGIQQRVSDVGSVHQREQPNLESFVSELPSNLNPLEAVAAFYQVCCFWTSWLMVGQMGPVIMCPYH